MNHKLKTLSQYFEQVLAGYKTFEIRENDRDFKVRDTLELLEIDNDTKEFTGRTITRKVTYILPGGQYGLDDEYVIMSLK